MKYDVPLDFRKLCRPLPLVISVLDTELPLVLVIIVLECEIPHIEILSSVCKV